MLHVTTCQEMIVSDPKPPTSAPAATAKPGDKPAGPAVIRQLHGAEETDRLVKKHLPAWVISGAVHLILILFAWLVLANRPADVVAKNELLSTAVEKEDEPPVKDLTNEDPGIESTLTAAVDVDRIEERTVDNIVTKDDIGVPNTTMEDTVAYAPIGVVPSETNVPGATGEFGSAISGGGGAGSQINASFLGRSGATKEKMLREGGGNEGSELAVARGLAWLAKQQKADGSWRFDGSHKEDTIAATGMALLPFLAAGETHINGKKYKMTVLRGLQYLVNNLNASTGRFNARGGVTMYSHGIATIALCEAYGMTKDRGFLLRPCQAAINLIQSVQHSEGGWRYAFQPTPGDTSVVGWQIQALQAARLSKDIVVDDKVIRKAEAFLDLVSGGGGSRKATYGYTNGPGAAGTSMTAVGLLCRYYISGWGPNNGGMAEGVEGLIKNGPKPGTKEKPEPLGGRGGDLYYYYYATQVVHFFGGKEWKDWNEGPIVNGKRTIGMRDWLVNLQVKNGADMGSWDPDRGSIGSSCGRVGSTCLCLLTLEVYYRHLPLFKRDNAGGGENLK
jgi:hypothetical protein